VGTAEEGNWILMSTSPQVEIFVELVREYCNWVEAGQYQDLSWLYLHLSKLHSAVLEIPAIEPDTDGGTDLEVPSEEYQKVVSSLQGGLSVDFYWEVLDPLDMDDHGNACGSLRDDIADIWRDLKEELLNFDAGRRNDATFGWKFSFETHWGRHLTSALRVLYAHLY
jgi:Domain of unknown function (DUF5063)